MVGERDCGRSKLGDALTKPIDAAGSVKKRVLGVNVKMNELAQLCALNPWRG